MGRACVVVVVVHLLTAATVTALVVMPNDDLCVSLGVLAAEDNM